MKFDIDKTLANMIEAIKDSLGKNWKSGKETVEQFLQARKMRLDFIIMARLEEEISDGFFKKSMEEEEKILAAELHAVAIIAKAAAQHAANAALEVLYKAVRTALAILP